MNLADELRKLNEPLTADALGRVFGYPAAAIQHVVIELHMPAGMFIPAYTFQQAKVIAAKVAELELETLDKNTKGTSNAGATIPHSRPRIANPAAGIREHLEDRRAGRVGR